MKHRFAIRAATLAAVAISLTAGVLIQEQVLLSSDVGWLIRSVRLMLEGQRFGVELFEPNLPVMWFLCLPAALAVEYLGIPEVTAIRAWIWTLAGLSLLVARACVLNSPERDHRFAAEFSAASLAACVLIEGSFGQREHLAFLLSLPYLFVVRLRYAEVQIPRVLAGLAGAMAGLAFSIKPVFVLVPATVELAIWIARCRRWRLLRVETIALAVAGIVAVALCIALAPDYLREVVPVTYATYWAYDVPTSWLFRDYPVAWSLFLGWAVAIVVNRELARSSLPWFAVFCAWTATYFIQGRAFDYHGFPALASALVLSIGAFASLVASLREKVTGRWTEWIGRPPLLKTVLAAAVVAFTVIPVLTGTHVWYRAQTEPDWALSRTVSRTELMNLLRSLGVTEKSSILSFSMHPYPAFPTVNYLHAKWVGPDMAQFLLPAWLRRHEITDAARLAAIDVAMAVQRHHVRTAMLEGTPDFILVNALSRLSSEEGAGLKRINFFQIFGSDPALSKAFSRYDKVGDLRGVQIYARRSET